MSNSSKLVVKHLKVREMQSEFTIDCVNLIAEKIFLNLQKIDFYNTLNKHIQLLDKMVYFTNVCNKKIAEFNKIIGDKAQAIPRFKLKSLSLLNFDCYNRHDLFGPFIRNLVFNIFANLKSLVFPAFDSGRCEAAIA